MRKIAIGAVTAAVAGIYFVGTDTIDVTGSMTPATAAEATFLSPRDPDARISESIDITGTVTAPPGHTVEGLVARQCLNGCSWYQDYPLRGTGRSTEFAVHGNPGNAYEIMFYKDVGGDDDGPGDLYGRVPYVVRTGTGDHHARLYEYSQMKDGALDAELRGEKPLWPGEEAGERVMAAPAGLAGSFHHASSGRKVEAKATVTTKAAIASGPQGIVTGPAQAKW